MTATDRNSSGPDRVREALDGQPLEYAELIQSLGRAKSTVDTWLRECVRDGDVFYVYTVPEEITDWRGSAKGLDGKYKFHRGINMLSPNSRNNLSPGIYDRYYCRTVDTPLLRTEHPTLFQWDEAYSMSVSFGRSFKEQRAHRTFGGVETVIEALFESLNEGGTFSANVSVESHHPVFTFQMMYQGAVTEPVVEAVLDNVQTVANRVADYINQESVSKK